MKVHRTVLTKRDLLALTSEEQLLAVSAMLILNEVNTLLAAVLMSVPSKEEPNETIKEAQHCQALFYMTLLAGKVNEAWATVSSSILESPAYRQRVNVLTSPTREAIAHLKAYFDNKRAPLRLLRNKLSFHYDQVAIAAAYNVLDPDEAFKVWLPEHAGGARFEIGKTLTALTTERLFRQGTEGSGFERLLKDIGTVTHDLSTFLFGMLQLLLPAFVRRRTTEVELPPEAMEMIPAFPSLNLLQEERPPI
jgi:hypothetical protein